MNNNNSVYTCTKVSLKHGTSSFVVSLNVKMFKKSFSLSVSKMLRTTCFAISCLKPVMEPCDDNTRQQKLLLKYIQ